MESLSLWFNLIAVFAVGIIVQVLLCVKPFEAVLRTFRKAVKTMKMKSRRAGP